MGFLFAPGLSACDTSGHLVFLDVRTDRYFALTGSKRDTCLAIVAGKSASDGDPAIDALVAAGILVRRSGSVRPVLCPPPPPIESAVRGNAVSAGIFATASAIGFGLSARRALRNHSLRHLLADFVRAKQRMPPRTRAARDPRELAAAFARADRLLSPLDRCLPRSLALARALIAAGIAPILVFGVKMRPFEAHCWVQHDGLLLGDELPFVAPFSPILVL